jgi:hypothetical protein
MVLFLGDDQLAKRKTTTKKEQQSFSMKQTKQRKMEDSPGSTDEITSTYISEDSSNKSPMDA